MSLEECKRLITENKYSNLVDYCKRQQAINPAESMYSFYEAIGLIYLHRIEEARGLLKTLYEREGKPIYKIIIAMTYFIEGMAKEGAMELNEAIERENNVEELLLIFQVAIEEMLLVEGQKAVKKAIKTDKKKAIEAVHEYFENLSQDSRLTQEDRLMMLDSVSLFEKILERV